MELNSSTGQTTPRLEIDLRKIEHNTRQLCAQLQPLGIKVSGVTKCCLGDPKIARAMLSGGVDNLADSRLENIQRMRRAGIDAQFMLLRSPQASRIAEVVRDVDISLNSEISIVNMLNQAAQRQQRLHRIVLMLELGDLREGIVPADLMDFVAQCQAFKNIHIIGLGTNLTCLSGVMPSDDNMQLLLDSAAAVSEKFDLKLPLISAGNSASLDWVFNTVTNTSVKGRQINNLRLGEALMLGRETLYRQPIEGLYQDAFSLVTEVIEVKIKPSIPQGALVQNAFGNTQRFREKGLMQRSIVNIGEQDTLTAGLTLVSQHQQLLGASSDHLVIDSSAAPLTVADQVVFIPNYGALLAAMTSPFVSTYYL